MKGVISFHPVDVSFFDDTIQPLAAGDKINPEPFILAASRQQNTAGAVTRFRSALERLIEASTPPPPPPGAGRWERLRTWMERADYRADPSARTAARVVEADLHLCGRPFLITEISPEKVVGVVDRYVEAGGPAAVHDLILDQVRRLDTALAEGLRPDLDVDTVPDGVYRSELLNALKAIHALSRAARQGGTWSGPDGPEPACTVVGRELPWLSTHLHGQAVPYWVARDVDGLETVCRAAGLAPPEVFMPAWRLFGALCEEFPALREGLDGRLSGPRSIGAFVSADDVPAVLEFLKASGARIIQAATQAGEGSAASIYLTKVRECLTYAASHDLGYLEAVGIDVMGIRGDNDL